jgi:hypothetical protein
MGGSYPHHPKIDGRCLSCDGFCQLNKMLKQKLIPITNIQDLLQSLNGMKYASAIDLSMGYYHIPLCPKSQEYCTIVQP